MKLIQAWDETPGVLGTRMPKLSTLAFHEEVKEKKPPFRSSDRFVHLTMIRQNVVKEAPNRLSVVIDLERQLKGVE